MTDAILAKMPGHKLDRFVFSFVPRSSPSLRRLLIYGVAARQCAKNRLPPIAAGRIQRNRVGVSWHTTLLAKSSVLYLCKGEGSTDRLRAPISAVKIVEHRLADGANCTCLPAFLPSAEQRYTKPRRSGRVIVVLKLCFALLPTLAYAVVVILCLLADLQQLALFLVCQFFIIDLGQIAEHPCPFFFSIAFKLGKPFQIFFEGLRRILF